MKSVAALTFDEASHTYRVGGAVWPSVTQVLDPLNTLDGIPWAVLEAAREFGTHVHQSCHLANVGTLDEDALDPALRPYLDGWRRFLRETGATVVHSELRVAHPTLRYAGTLDAVVRWPRLLADTVVDIKSGAVPRTVGPQTAAYREAYTAVHGARSLSPVRYCVQLVGDGEYRLTKLTDPGDFNLFRSALNIHHWRNRSV